MLLPKLNIPIYKNYNIQYYHDVSEDAIQNKREVTVSCWKLDMDVRIGPELDDTSRLAPNGTNHGHFKISF